MGKGRRSSWSANVLALLLPVIVAFLFEGCAGAPKREVPRGEPPRVPPPAAEPGPAVPAFRPQFFAGRPVRVLLGGPRTDLSIEGAPVRAWSVSGVPVAEESGALRLSAHGDRIVWGRVTLSSPIDIGSPSGLTFAGKRISGRIRVSARGGRLLAVAVVPLEDYVAAVVSREAPASFHPEALSALAVAVRTYAVLATGKPRDPTHDVVAGVEDQVFEGMDGVAGVFLAAAGRTSGEVLSYRGELARTVYHSTCGGRTESAMNAWGTDVPYLRSIACDDCRASPVFRWDFRMTAKDGERVALALGVRASGDLRIAIVEWTSTGRASRIRLSSRRVSLAVSAAAFRRAAGYARVRSLKLEIVPVGSGWVISGEGYGHGVGMCQWGADGMAKSGKSWREILERYYPGTVLARTAP